MDVTYIMTQSVPCVSYVESNYTGWPPKNGTVDFLGLCSDQQFFFHLAG